MVLPNVQLPRIQTRKAGHGGAHLFLGCNLGSKEMPNVPKKLVMGFNSFSDLIHNIFDFSTSEHQWVQTSLS
jgi:hypothetical protein